MAVFKKNQNDPKSTWIAKFYYTDWTGKKRQKKKEGFEKKSDAQAYERDFLDKINAGSEMLFSSLIERYFEDIELELKPTTIENKKYIINSKILPYFGEKRISDISTSDINDWHRELKKKNYEPTYLRTIRNQISAIFNYAIDTHNHNYNPVKKAKKMGEKKAKKMKFYTIDEFNRFIKSFENNSTLYIIFLILFYTGIRVGELLALKPNDFDFQKMTLRVDENYQVVKKKKLLLSPKSESGFRTISIPSKLALDIQDYLSKLHGIRKNDLIFKVSKSYLNDHIKEGAEIAGVKKIRVHDLRHSHASLLIEEGKFSYKLIAERLGHSSTKELDETYGHLYPNKDNEVGVALNDLY